MAVELFGPGDAPFFAAACLLAYVCSGHTGIYGGQRIHRRKPGAATVKPGTPLRDAVEPFDNVTLHFVDAVALEASALDPPPDKVIAKLPYNVAATVILNTVVDLLQAAADPRIATT